MGPKRTQYERCRKALNALDLVYQLCEGGVNSTHTAVHEKLSIEFDEVLHDVMRARRRFDNARIRVSDLQRLIQDNFWTTEELEVFKKMQKRAGAELNMAEQEWNDI